MTDIDAVVGVAETLERGAQHVADDGAFVPRGHEDGEPARPIRRGHPVGKGAGKTTVDGRRSPEAAGEIKEIDQEVVEREQEEADRCEQRQFPRNGGNDRGERHGCATCAKWPFLAKARFIEGPPSSRTEHAIYVITDIERQACPSRLRNGGNA